MQINSSPEINFIIQYLFELHLFSNSTRNRAIGSNIVPIQHGAVAQGNSEYNVMVHTSCKILNNLETPVVSRQTESKIKSNSPSRLVSHAALQYGEIYLLLRQWERFLGIGVRTPV